MNSQRIWASVFKKATLILLLRDTGLGLIFIFNVKVTRVPNVSSFVVTGFLNKLGHYQNENSNI